MSYDESHLLMENMKIEIRQRYAFCARKMVFINLGTKKPTKEQRYRVDFDAPRMRHIRK